MWIYSCLNPTNRSEVQAAGCFSRQACNFCYRRYGDEDVLFFHLWLFQSVSFVVVVIWQEDCRAAVSSGDPQKVTDIGWTHDFFTILIQNFEGFMNCKYSSYLGCKHLQTVILNPFVRNGGRNWSSSWSIEAEAFPHVYTAPWPSLHALPACGAAQELSLRMR